MDVVCLGILVADVVARPVDALPSAGSLGYVEEIGVHGGGCALNTASALVALGLEATVAGMVGTDPLGDFLVQVLHERGIDVAGVLRDTSTPTSATVALVDSGGERTFLHVPGANAAIGEEQLAGEVVYSGRALHLAGALVMERLDGEPFARVAAEARRRGILTSLDVVWDPTGRWERLEPALPHLDLAMPSLAEGRALSGETEPALVAAWLRERGVREVALTMGADGCYASGAGFEGHVAAPHVVPVDSTGAGDAFAAGLLRGKLAGCSFEESIRLGCAAGALSTTSVGATWGGHGLPDVLGLAGLEPSTGRRQNGRR